MTRDKLIKAINYCLYGLVIAVPLIYFPTTFFPFNIIKVVLLQILIELMFALWIALALFYPEYRPRLTPLIAALGVFSAALLLSTFFGVDWRASLWSDEQRAFGVIGIMHLALLVLITSSLKNKIEWRKILLFSFAAATLVSLIGISQKLVYVPSQSVSSWLYIIFPIANSPNPLDRIGSTLSNSAFLAGYLLFGLFIGFWFLVGETRKHADRKANRRAKQFLWFLAAGEIVILAAIFLTQTLGALLGLGLGVLFLVAYYIIKGKGRVGQFSLRSIALACLAFLVILGSFVFFTRGDAFWDNVPGFSRISKASLKTPSIHDRLLVWNIALAAFKDYPFLGWGPENFRIAYDKHYNPEILNDSIGGTNWDKPHNTILEYLTDTGILGLLAYLLLWAAVIYCLLRIGKSGNDNHLGPVFGAMLISYFSQNLFVFDTVGTYLMFFVVLGFIDYQYQKTVLSAKEVRAAGSINDKNLKVVTLILILISLVPIYYSYAIFSGAQAEYWGVNYMLNRLPESSLLSFRQAVTIPTPYLNDIEQHFADAVRQAPGQGINLSAGTSLQNEIISYLRDAINRHPLNFYNYLTLAEFETAFYQSNPKYLDDAQAMLQKAINFSPERQQIYYPLAKIMVLKGDIKGAYDIFKHLVNLNPNAGEPHFYFGILAYEVGDIKTADAEIARAAELGRKPATSDEMVALANFVGDYDRNYPYAVELYKSALDYLSRAPQAQAQSVTNIRLKLAVAYYFNKDYDNSRQTFLDLEQQIDLKSLPIYPQLKPVLQELHLPQ